jgi:hypothetical protein
VVVDPVDLSNDGFKQRVKLVLQAVARTKGDADFVAQVYDNQGAADWEWAHVENGPESCEIDGPCGPRPPPPEDPAERRRFDEQFTAEQQDSQRHYGRDETWNIATTCDATSGDCTGEVTSSAGRIEPIRREHFGPWTLERRDAETGWDCGFSTPRDFSGRRADIKYSWDPATGSGTVSWVAPRNTCMPDEEDYTTSFGLKP